MEQIGVRVFNLDYARLVEVEDESDFVFTLCASLSVSREVGVSHEAVRVF